MKIESNQNDLSFFLLEKTMRSFRKFSQREFLKRDIDLSIEQWSVLSSIYETPGISQKEIAELTQKDPASMTRMIDLLEKKKLLVREKATKDRRIFSISLTDEGVKYVEEIIPLTAEMRKFGLKSVSNADKALLIEVLKKICENLE